MYLLRGTLYPLHVADAADPRALLREAPLAKRKKETDRHTLCSMRTRQSAKSPRVQKLRGQREGERERERESCVPWSRRFDQWEQRDVGSPLHRRRDRASFLVPFFRISPSPAVFYLVSSSIILLLVGHPPLARSNCQSSCNDLEKASFERSRLVECAGKRRTATLHATHVRASST